jgi:hypothetical protein
MNLINRLAIVLICLALVAGAGAVIGLAWAAPQESIDWLADAANWLDDHNTDGTKGLITLVAALVAVAGFVVLIMELFPSNRGEVNVSGLQVGDAVLTTGAIGQRIEEAVNQVPNVSDVRATVRAKRKGVTVALDLHVDPEANLAAVTDAACEAARDVLSDKVHVDLLAPPRARLHYRELRLRGRQARASTSVQPQELEPLPEDLDLPPPQPEPETPPAAESELVSEAARVTSEPEKPAQV